MSDILYIILLALPIGLAAFNAAFWGGVYRCLCVSDIVLVAFAFMLFMTGMFFLGSWTGTSFANSMGWLAIPIAEAVILLTGIKLIYSALRMRPEQKSYDLEKKGELIAVSFAVSLNAFMIGLGIGLLRAISEETFAIIAVATAAFTVGGAYAGKRSGKFIITQIAGIMAGIVVLALGLLAALNLYQVI